MHAGSLYTECMQATCMHDVCTCMHVQNCESKYVNSRPTPNHTVNCDQTSRRNPRDSSERKNNSSEGRINKPDKRIKVKIPTNDFCSDKIYIITILAMMTKFQQRLLALRFINTYLIDLVMTSRFSILKSGEIITHFGFKSWHLCTTKLLIYLIISPLQLYRPRLVDPQCLSTSSTLVCGLCKQVSNSLKVSHKGHRIC